ncbi:hypothetical protein IW150_005330 [Coemansia sp. RSA 2607]|nr:hypothetical protein IW150_005330 [Coemansia sp. RSA 2607]
MSEFVAGVRMVYVSADEDTFGAVEFPFDQIGSYREVHDIPRYSFHLERQVEREVVQFRDEMTVRSMHLEHQRRPVRRKTAPQLPMPPPLSPLAAPDPRMLRMSTTPIGAILDLTNGYDSDEQPVTDDASDSHTVHVVSPDTIKTRLPALKKQRDERPKTSRLKTLFRSKTRSTLPGS